MPTKRTASKVTSKAKLNIDLGEDESPKRKGGRTSKRMQKKAVKTIKKFKPMAIILAVLFLAIGVGGGWFATKMICKSDCFTLIGNDELAMEVDAPYYDQGVKIIAFGKDVKDSVEIDTNLTKNTDGSYTSHEEGTFYIRYKSTCFKYGKLFKVEKVRLITFDQPKDIDAETELG